MSIAHLYVSTGCVHNEHGSCRQTCKFCGEPCICPCHPGGVQSVEPISPVDQARGAARVLYALVREHAEIPPAQSWIEEDPSFFWLRGGEQPPGEWRPPS